MQGRLQRISKLQTELESEKSKRERLSNNYRKALTVVNMTEGVLAMSFAGLETISLVFLTSVVAMPAVTIMQSISLGAGLLFIIGGFLTRNLILRAEKHEKIKRLAEKKLNVISDLVSKALKDGTVSDEEYSLIIAEIDKFTERKELIRAEAKKRIKKEPKGLMINKALKNAFKKR